MEFSGANWEFGLVSLQQGRQAGGDTMVGLVCVTVRHLFIGWERERFGLACFFWLGDSPYSIPGVPLDSYLSRIGRERQGGTPQVQLPSPKSRMMSRLELGAVHAKDEPDPL